MGEELVLWRGPEGKIIVMRDRCPHRSAKLSLGKIVNGNIQCRYHGFQYDREGDVQLIPANGRNGPKPAIFKCHNYIAQEAQGFIWLWNGSQQETYPPIPWFDNLDARFTYGSWQRRWEVSYIRAIESLLDISHIPFVHPNTIGHHHETLVNGPYTTLENNKITVWYSNQPDAGLPATKPSQLPRPETTPAFCFYFPNIYQLRISENLRLVIICAPINDDYVVIYMRNYQNFILLPGLSHLINRTMNIFTYYVLNEDYVIVRTQQPKKNNLNIGEQFVPSDRPIALYLSHRRELIKRAESVENE
jgi:phenylpropionate dioxygenase-like ring-hydroxylating dioxygenase large terminal subunit